MIEMEKYPNRETMQEVYRTLQKRGYCPINQIVGFLITEDPTYITSTDGARNKVLNLEPEDLLKEIVACYFEQ